MAGLANTISNILGGEKVLLNNPSEIKDFEKMVENGLPIVSADSLAEASGFTIDDVLSKLGISKSTYARKKRKLSSSETSRLELPASDRLFRIAYIIAKAQNVFGNPEKAAKWLHSPNRALEGRTPFDALNTGVGEKRIEALLVALEWGDPMI